MEEEKRGTRRMGAAARPTAHPYNQQAAHWSPRSSDDEHYVYVLTEESSKAQRQGPIESILEAFNNWSVKAHNFASNLWNMRAAPSKTDVAWGKLKLTAKVITEGGFESIYKQTFPTHPDEKLKKTFACYLSTTTGPVAGTLYVSNSSVAFCSDRPLSFNAPSGQEVWTYYKVLIPMGRISSVNAVTLGEKPPERYTEIVTVDGHEFWFMGFISYEQALKHIREALTEHGTAVARAVGPTASNYLMRQG